MGGQYIDRETLREVFIYLYRCWIEKYLGEVPSQLALSPDDGILVSGTFALYFSTDPVEESVVSDLRARTQRPVLFIAPAFPSGVVGISDLAKPAPVGEPFDHVLSVVRKKLKWLDLHRERGLTRREAYQTEEHGNFTLWKGRSATRLLFQPSNGELYGYAVIQNAPKDFFFRKSRSCKEEGSKAASGRYKRSQHRVEQRSNLNIDLLYEGGEVLLLHLTLAGAGYKVFPRQTPEPDPSFP